MPRYAENCATVPYFNNKIQEYNLLRSRKAVSNGLIGLRKKYLALCKERDEKIAKGVISQERIAEYDACINKIAALLSKYQELSR